MKKIIISSLSLIFLSACSGKDPCEDNVMAYVMSQKAVKYQLIAPASATFPTYNIANGASALPSPNKNTNPNQCYFHFEGYVDTQNAFGAMLRKRYEGEIMYDKTTKKWSNTSLKFLN